MTDRDTVVRGLHDIAGFIAGKIGIEQARNFLRTIDDVISMLKDQEETINVLGDTIRQMNQHIKDISEYMTPYGKVKDIKAYAESLKEQEAVEPIPPTDESDLWKCGNCNHQLFRCTHQRYCEMCGKPVKWDD